MPERLYRVEDIITIVGVGYTRANSKAEAYERARNRQVEFVYNDGADVRRGDGLHVYTATAEETARQEGPTDA